MDLKEKIIDVNRIYEGKKINVDVLKVKMPNNKEAIREIVDRKNGVVILAIDDENNVIVEEQYRNTFKRGIVGLPAGKRDGAEDLLDTAKRELEEETGAIACYLPAGESDVYNEPNEFFNDQPIYSTIVEYSSHIPEFTKTPYHYEARECINTAVVNIVNGTAKADALQEAQDTLQFKMTE